MPYEVCTPVFQGDLELLTQLVGRQELDVFELCLSALVAAYLAESAERESPDLEMASEFLLLTSTLVELKSRYLLVEDDDDGDDEWAPPEDRDLLLARLLQGRTFREAAAALAAFIRAADRSVARQAGPEEPLASVDVDPLEAVTPDELRQALWRALAPRPMVDLHHVAPIRASVSDAIDRVFGAVTRCEQLSFFDLTAGEPDRLEVIVRFLAVLELFKRGLVDIEQAAAFGDLVVRSRPPDGDELGA
jgi:segregation and condensation protein A